MRVLQATPDNTSVQNLRNSIGAVEAAHSNSEIDLRQIEKEFEFLTENGSPEHVAAAKYNVARCAIALDRLMPRLQSLLETMRKLAGEKALGIAAAPVKFNR